MRRRIIGVVVAGAAGLTLGLLPLTSASAHDHGSGWDHRSDYSHSRWANDSWNDSWHGSWNNSWNDDDCGNGHGNWNDNDWGGWHNSSWHHDGDRGGWR
ncbi:hypothetical protein ACGFXC_22290 [Streptomyces sp. NPDC048507]|uniref:hypothetical protein n=1 Tax=Streptomyces sp. NPDC048507 TaxID=3365560 RepID=UPI00371AC5F4